MKRSRFTEEQIIGILKEQEAGQKTADILLRNAAGPYIWVNLGLSRKNQRMAASL